MFNKLYKNSNCFAIPKEFKHEAQIVNSINL